MLAKKKNLFDQKVKDDVAHRLLRLQPQATPAWGCMSPAEMMRHCGEALRATIYFNGYHKPTSFQQAVARFFIINIIPALPKNARAPRALDVKQQDFGQLSFEYERDFFLQALEEFFCHDQEIKTSHPYFGNLTRRQWGIITWMHLDHHLRQFNV